MTIKNGVWANPDGLCDWAGTADNNVMAPYMHYAMDVAGSPLIDMDWDVRMSEMDAVWTPLQSLEPGDSVVIRQVYTLDETAGNEFQGDEIVFDIELYGEQLMAPGPTSDAKAVVLENKSGDPHWTPVMDNIWGLLTWDDSGNYRVRAWNLAGTQYQMQAWDAVNDSSYGMFGSTYGGGDVDDTDLYTGLNTNTDAKYWLRDTDTYSPTLTLWEATLVN